MNENKIEVQLCKPERLYVKIYHDFLDSQLISGDEKMVFIILKRYADFRADQNGIDSKVWPTIDTICKATGKSRPTITKIIKSLQRKGIVKVIRQGLTKPNLYMLCDYADMWRCKTVEEMKEVVENDGSRPLTAGEHIAALSKMGYEVNIKKEGPDCQPAKVNSQAPSQKTYNDITSKSQKSQERYSFDDIKQLFGYSILQSDYPQYQQDTEAAFAVLYDALNTSKDTIRVSGEDKPAMVVIGKLMKLESEDIAYAVQKYNEIEDRIKNHKAYILTILYSAREQRQLDWTNLGHSTGDF